MADKFAVQYGMLHGCIFIGRLNKAQTMFLEGKEDHTNPAVFAAAEYIAAKWDGQMDLSNGRRKFRITVEELDVDDGEANP